MKRRLQLRARVFVTVDDDARHNAVAELRRVLEAAGYHAPEIDVKPLTEGKGQ